MTKFLAHFFISSSVTNIGEQFMRIHKIFWQLLWKLWEHFFKDLRGRWKHKVLKEKAISPKMKKFWSFFSFYQTWQTSGKNWHGSTGCFDNYCANDNIISPGPKSSIETNFSKIAVFTMKKDLAHFSSYYRVWQNSRKILEGSTSFCDIYTGK